MPYISIQLVVEDTEVLTSYDPPATNRYVKRFEAGRDNASDAWYAIYCKKGGISHWIADCADIGIARECAKALGKKYGYTVEEEFPAGWKIRPVERPLAS